MKIIFDLDGTLADCTHRLELRNNDWLGFYKNCIYDKPILPMIRMNQSLRLNNIEIWTGRSDLVRQETLDWLKENNVFFNSLKMRKNGNYIPDNILKERWLYDLPKEAWPELVFEDRSRVVEMWRRNNIMCCQVTEGGF